MGWKLLASFFVITLLTGSEIGFVKSVPVKSTNVGETLNDETVKELESLKEILSEAKDGSNGENEVSISESQTSVVSNVNGYKSGHKEVKDEVVKNGKTCAKFSQKIDVMKNKEEIPKSAVETEVEIPSKGIHYIMKTEPDSEVAQEKKEDNNFEMKRTRNDVDKINNFSEIKYSPHHMAEYIFWTGDEKGVALTIEEFLQEGLMSRQEAINFLQSIKYNLDLMQSQYQGLDKVDGKIYNKEILNQKRKVLSKIKSEKPKKNIYEEQVDNPKLLSVDLPDVKSNSPDVLPDSKNLKQSSSLHKSVVLNTDSSSKDYTSQRSKTYPKLPLMSKAFEGRSENYDYDETAERLRATKLSQKEYSLEEVIFELAEIMFSESLTKGNLEAQKAMQRFSVFLQKEVEDGQISRKLQRKIIDILSSALLNVLSEHSELLNTSKEELQLILNQISPPSEALRQLLRIGTKQLSDQPSPEEGLPGKTILLENKKLSEELLQNV